MPTITDAIELLEKQSQCYPRQALEAMNATVSYTTLSGWLGDVIQLKAMLDEELDAKRQVQAALDHSTKRHTQRDEYTAVNMKEHRELLVKLDNADRCAATLDTQYKNALKEIEDRRWREKQALLRETAYVTEIEGLKKQIDAQLKSPHWHDAIRQARSEASEARQLLENAQETIKNYEAEIGRLKGSCAVWAETSERQLADIKHLRETNKAQYQHAAKLEGDLRNMKAAASARGGEDISWFELAQHQGGEIRKLKSDLEKACAMTQSRYEEIRALDIKLQTARNEAGNYARIAGDRLIELQNSPNTARMRDLEQEVENQKSGRYQLLDRIRVLEAERHSTKRPYSFKDIQISVDGTPFTTIDYNQTLPFGRSRGTVERVTVPTPATARESQLEKTLRDAQEDIAEIESEFASENDTSWEIVSLALTGARAKIESALK